MASRRKSDKTMIARAIKRPGALTAKARNAGESIDVFARKHEHDSGRTGDQSRFYENVLKKVHRPKLRTPRRKRVKIRKTERTGARR